MIGRIKKVDFYKALLEALKAKEDYELCAKLRDAIIDIENPDEIIEVDLDEFQTKNNRTK